MKQSITTNQAIFLGITMGFFFLFFMFLGMGIETSKLGIIGMVFTVVTIGIMPLLKEKRKENQ